MFGDIGVFIKPAQKFSGKPMVKMKSLTRPAVFTVWGRGGGWLLGGLAPSWM